MKEAPCTSEKASNRGKVKRSIRGDSTLGMNHSAVVAGAAAWMAESAAAAAETIKHRRSKY